MPNTRLLSVVILAVSLFTTSAFAARPEPHHARVTQGKRHKAKHHPKAAKKHAHSRHKKHHA